MAPESLAAAGASKIDFREIIRSFDFRLLQQYRHETDMPKYLGDVRCWMNIGKHMLAWSFSGFGPKADIGFAGEVQPRRTFTPTQEILSLLLAVKRRPQEPVSPNLRYHLCPLVHYQHRHASVG
jgi:hypothetical protein